MANRRSVVSLQQFPIQVFTKIVQKFGKASSADYCNLRATCKNMSKASNNPEVLHSLCLSPLVKKPLCAIQHSAIPDKCREHEKCAAFIVEGILTYFVDGNEERGMAYLHQAAMEGNDEVLEACYLYGVMRFLHGDPLGGPFNEMAFKNWREDEEDLVARVWKNLRRIMHGIPVDKKPVYLQSLWSRRPGRSCHILDMEINCPTASCTNGA